MNNIPEIANGLKRRPFVEDKSRLTYIYGPPGAGKTTLLRKTIADERKGQTALYYRSDELLDDLVEAIQNKETTSFKERILNHGVSFGFDNVEFLQGKDGTQEFLYFLIQDLLNQGRKVYVAGVESPDQLTDMDIRLKAMFRCARKVKVPVGIKRNVGKLFQANN